jgi:hypothetical protein
MKIQQKLDKLSMVCEKSEIVAITRKLDAYLDGILKNKNIDNFGSEIEILKKKLRERTNLLDKEMTELAFKLYAKTKNRKYANYIDELQEINKGNFTKTADILKWEDLISYVETRFK